MQTEPRENESAKVQIGKVKVYKAMPAITHMLTGGGGAGEL